MLYLVGLGLDKEEITLKGLRVLETCDTIFAEFYTNTAQDLSWLEERLNKKITVLDREGVERPEEILTAAQKGKTAVLVSGDPIAATTHLDLRAQAQEKDIEVRVIHAPSILLSAGESGLSLYKFSRTVTLPKPQEGYFPVSPYEQIKANKDAELHTLILLDIDFRAEEALALLAQLEEKQWAGLFIDTTELIILERMNTESQKIHFDTFKHLKAKDFGETPHALILPGKIDESERTFVTELTQIKTCP